MAVRVEFGLLGPLYVRSEGVTLPVTAARQRVVLAALAVRAGQVVSFEELSAAIWGNSPPSGARVAVRNQVSRLRQRLGNAGRHVVTRDPGYFLDATESDVDLLAFARLCREGGAAVHAGAWPRASDLLRDALRLWRRIPLTDVPSRALRDEHVPAVGALRLQAIEWQIEAGLHTGRHDELVTELEGLIKEHPLRERFRAQLMLALYRCDRQGDALAVYRSARDTLATELGVEPGQHLRELHQRILAADPELLSEVPSATPGHRRVALAGAAGEHRPDTVVPRQLPADPRHFAGRHDELDALSLLLPGASEPGGISAISGTAGVGKTTLGVHWAHLVAEKFPDGQLYVNLRGFDGSAAPVTPGEVIRDFLGALGVPPERIPVSSHAQVALYRTVVTGKRLLIVLDNARDPDQVRPLLPGSPGCLVLVTSRAELTGLAAIDDAHLLSLDLLTKAEARGLLISHLGIGRVATEQAAVDELIELCARLPLALGIAAARAAARPRFPLAALAAELRGAAGRLDALDTGQPASSVRAVFSWSYQQLSELAARLFRLLGLHPGPDICAPAAASLATLPLPVARTALHALSRASLISELAPGRYTMHALLRVYAAELSGDRDSGEDHRAAAERMLDHYLHTADTAARLLDPVQETYIPGSPAVGVTPEVITDRDQALAWFATERKVLLAVTRNASTAGFDAHAQRLSLTLMTYLDRGGHWPDLTASQHIALVCSERLGDLGGQAHAHRNLARAHTRGGQLDLARTHLLQAVRLARCLGDQVGEAEAHLHLSTVCEAEQRPWASLRSSLRALDLAETAGSPALRAMACNNVGYLYATLGDSQTALAYCQRALREQSQLVGPSTLKASIWDSLGYIYQDLGDHRQATESYLRAAGLFRELGARRPHAKTLSNLGDAYRLAGDMDASRHAWEQALITLADLNDPGADLVRTKLRDAEMAM